MIIIFGITAFLAKFVKGCIVPEDVFEALTNSKSPIKSKPI